MKPAQINNAAIISRDQIEVLAQAGVIPSGTPPAQVEVFAEACRQHGLSPFKKEIYLIRYGNTYSNIVGIEGLQQKANRTGRFAGIDPEKYDVRADGSFLTATELKERGQKPISCSVTVYAIVGGVRCPFTAVAVFDEYYPNPSGKAATMPFNMIAKCARAKALKMAFSDELSGLSIEEEGAAIADTTIQAVEIMPENAVDVEALRAKVLTCTTKEELTKLYKSVPLYKKFAYIFTERALSLEKHEEDEQE